MGRRRPPAGAAFDAAHGTQVWVRPYNGPGDSFDFATAVTVSPDSSKVFVTGQRVHRRHQLLGLRDVRLQRGHRESLWSQRFNGPADGYDSGNALAASPDGSRLFVTGNIAAPSFGSSYATLAYSAI